MPHVPHDHVNGQANGQAPTRRPQDRRFREAATTTDPAGLSSWAATLLPVVEGIRVLAEDATAIPAQRVHSRLYLRRGLLKSLRELEARLHATVTPPG